MDTEEQNHQLPQVDPPGGATIGQSSDLPINSPADGVIPSQPVNQPQLGDPISDPSLSAEDLDLIEKAWVEKAKKIVKQTQGNPHTQNELMSKMKVDYMKKRYNRDIRIGE